MAGGQAGLSAGRRPIVEREQELQAIERCLNLSEQNAGQLLLIEGSAGIGKTRLLAEARALAGHRGFRVLAARGSELERGFGFGVVRQLFEPLISRADDTERQTLLGGSAQLAEPLFSLTAEPAPGPAADLGIRRLHGLYWLCANLAAEDPILISLDDGHWSDESSLRFLDYLARRLDGLRVFILVAHRPGEADANVEPIRQLSDEPGTTVLTPAALSNRAVGLLAEDVFGRAPDDAFTAACWRATGGNPFLVWELMESFAKGGGRPTADAGELIASLGPETVARSVATRLGRLAPSAGQFCKALAVLGGEAELRVIAALASAELDAVLADVDELGATGIVTSNGTVAFVHPTVNAAVYADMAPAERERKHAAAAHLLAEDGRAPEDVAAHVMRLHARGESWIVETLLSAGLRALTRGAPEAAIPLLRRALEEPPSAATRPDVLLALGSAELNVGLPDAAEHLREAVGHLTEPGKLASASVNLMHALAMGGRLTEAFESVGETIDRVAPRDREIALALEAMLGGALKVSDIQTPLSERWHRYGPITGKTPSERLLLSEVAWERAFGGGVADDVAEIAERSLAEAVVLGHVHQPPFFQAAYLMTICDRFTHAEAALNDALAAARALGSVLLTALAECWLANSALRSGRLADAEAHARAGVDIGAIIGYGDVFTPTRFLLIQVLAERGALSEASDVLDSAQVASDMPGGLPWRMALEGRAALRLAQGRAQEALVDLYSIRDLERADNPASCPWRSQAALALYALGEENQAKCLADEEVALARSFGAARAIGIALRVSGLVLGGAEGVSRLNEAVEVLQHSGAQLEHARALTDLGATMRRTGRRVDAREPLRQGLELAHTCGATALATRAHEELLASGARPRRLAFRGVESLTASERRVAEMAARGMGNVEIAQALFVSRKTIETHLGHVYAKLGIGSRDSLAPMLADATRDAAAEPVFNR